MRGAPPYFLLTSFCTMLLVTGMNILAPVLPGYAREFGVNATQVGLAVAAFAAGRLLFDFVGGSLSDRYGVRAICASGCAITACGSLACTLTGSFNVLLAARLAQGIGSALYMSAATVLVVSVLPRGQEGRWMSSFQGTFLLGLAVGPVVGGGVAQFFGDRAVFYAYALMAAFAMLLSIFSLPARPDGAERDDRDAPSDQGPAHPPEARRGELVAVLRHPAFVISLAILLVMYAMRAGVRNTAVPLFAEEELGMDPGIVGLLLTASALGQIMVMGHAGRSLDRLGRRPVVLRSLFAAALCVLLFPLATRPVLLVVIMVALGIVTAYSTAAPTVILVDVTPAPVRGSAIGIQRTFIDLGQLLGPVLAGAALDLGSYSGAFVLVGVLIVAAAVAALRLPETQPRVLQRPQ